MQHKKEPSELLQIIKFIAENKSIYLRSIIISVALAIIVTFILPKKYQSGGVIFPTFSNSLEETYNNPMFGHDVEADRILQLLQSQEIQDSISNRFNLIAYYKLDTLDKEWRDDLKKYFYRDIKFMRTPFMSIEITARTKDPKLSADIVDAIIELIDPMRNRILKQNIVLAHQFISNEYHQQKRTLDSLVDLIKNLRDEYGNPAISLLANQEFNFNKTVDANNTVLEEKIDKYHLQKAIYNDTKTKYERVKIQLERPLPGIYVINHATITNKKVSPSFVLNIVLTTALTIISVTVVLIVKIKIQEVNTYLKSN